MTDDLKTTGNIFNIQRFSTHDGPGVRTTVFLKGCPLECFWCQNLESRPRNPVLMHNLSLCLGCGRCAAVCKQQAITVCDRKAVIDRNRCDHCGMCVANCPQEALSLAGKTVTVEEVMAVIIKDRPYYWDSGGGVTLSGGEPTMQPEFALALLRACKAQGIHTAIETCGHTSWSIFENLLPWVDLVLYDLKKLDPEEHRQGTGKDNRLILENAKRLARTGKDLILRMPLIPGFNDSEEDVLQLLSFVKNELGRSSKDIELLRYNKLGEVKFEHLGLQSSRPSLEPQTDEYFEQLTSLLKE